MWLSCHIDAELVCRTCHCARSDVSFRIRIVVFAYCACPAARRIAFRDQGRDRMTLRQALLAATVLALPVAAQAQQPVTGLYIGAGVGANFRLDADGDYAFSRVPTVGAPTAAFSGKAKAVSDTGWAALGNLGWGFGNGLRAELEGNYRVNDIRKFKIVGVPGPTTGGG